MVTWNTHRQLLGHHEIARWISEGFNNFSCRYNTELLKYLMSRENEFFFVIIIIQS